MIFMLLVQGTKYAKQNNRVIFRKLFTGSNEIPGVIIVVWPSPHCPVWPISNL